MILKNFLGTYRLFFKEGGVSTLSKSELGEVGMYGGDVGGYAGEVGIYAGEILNKFLR